MQLIQRTVCLAFVAMASSYASSAAAQEYVVPNGHSAYHVTQAAIPTHGMHYWGNPTYITYQPFYLNELMYSHHARHYGVNHTGGRSTTVVHYSSSPVRSSVRGAWRRISLPRP